MANPWTSRTVDTNSRVGPWNLTVASGPDIVIWERAPGADAKVGLKRETGPEDIFERCNRFCKVSV